MKRQSLLIAACCLAAVSLGGNIWLLLNRKDRPAESGAATQTTPHHASVGPVLQPVTMDFSDTAFADGSWKLTDEADPSVSIDGKPFSWDDVKPDGSRVESPPRAGPLDAPPFRFDVWKTRKPEVPPYLDLPMENDPNDVRDKFLIAHPPPR